MLFQTCKRSICVIVVLVLAVSCSDDPAGKAAKELRKSASNALAANTNEEVLDNLNKALRKSSAKAGKAADPVRMAAYELEKYGRKNAVKAILLLSDGKPNNSATPATKSSKNYCADAFDAAKAAKAAKAKGIEVYTVGFGLDVEQDHICQDTYGTWKGKSAPDLLAAMATDSANDNGCPGTENDDGDNYFCLPKTSGASTDLSEVFKKAVAQLSGHSRLVDVD